MRWTALLAGVSCLALAQAGSRVTGRIAMLEKGDKPSSDLGAAVVYLDGGAAATAAPAAPVTVDVAIDGKEFVPRVVVVPVGSAVRFKNHDPFDHNVFSASRSNALDSEAVLKGLIHDNFVSQINTRIELTDKLLALPERLELTEAFNEAACAGAAQYGHDATCTPAADAAFAPHSANAPVTPHGRPERISVAMLTTARPIAPATSGHGP